ncbi:MAG: tRNA pseudouridine(55) synthase TruB [Acidobacteria bacterium]|nr:tRNA pseudouridine(55) synthase TruB [Acidobacteriota bacterium]
MDGVLVIDKPQGLTSHDVVAAARRLLGERRIGHTGTLDPLATGVLPLAIGRATRLVRFFAASDKEYDATIRFGLTTDSYDVTGAETSRTNAVPSRDEVLDGLRRLTGEYLQTPPSYSAKKVDGRRAYELARGERTVALAPSPVRVERAELVAFEGAQARVALTCSAGFYVRAFAHALGELLGTGACLEALRRTRAGEFTLEAAVRLEELHDPSRVASGLVALHALLGGLPAVTLTDRGREFAAHGREIEAGDYEPLAPLSPVRSPPVPWVRLLDARGGLVAVATGGRRAGSLHPSVVLI